eukprot:sb/3476765/
MAEPFIFTGVSITGLFGVLASLTTESSPTLTHKAINSIFTSPAIPTGAHCALINVHLTPPPLESPLTLTPVPITPAPVQTGVVVTPSSGTISDPVGTVLVLRCVIVVGMLLKMI